jgi:sec-independent protein translocase protein TatA
MAGKITDSTFEERNEIMQITTLAFGMPGPTEMLIVGGVAILIFGNRLPSVAKSLGRSFTEFKKGIAGIEDDIDSAVTADKKPAATATTAPIPEPAPSATTHN